MNEDRNNKLIKPRKSEEICVTYGAFEKLSRSLDGKTTNFRLELRHTREHLVQKIDKTEARLENRIGEVQAHLENRISEVQAHLENRISEVQFHSERKFEEVRLRINKLELKIDNVELRLSKEIGDIKVKLDSVSTAIHKLTALVEEQNARNKFVLDGYAQIYGQVKDNTFRIEALEGA